MLAKYILATILGVKSPTLKFLPGFEIDKIEDLTTSGYVLFFFLSTLVREKDFTPMTIVGKDSVRLIK